jgi:hypothetical protein
MEKVTPDLASQIDATDYDGLVDLDLELEAREWAPACRRAMRPR